MSDDPVTDDFASRLAAIERPDDAARTEASALLTAAGVSGRLADAAADLAGAQGRAIATTPRRVRALVLADAAPPRSAATADALDVGVRLLGHRRNEALQVDKHDAATTAEVEAALREGARLVEEEVDAGTDLIVLVVPDPQPAVPAAALIGLLVGTDASVVTPGGTADDVWMRDCADIRDAMRRGRPHLADQVALLATVGGEDLALATGILLGAAIRRTPVVLDGPVTAAAALVAARLAFRAPAWWLPGHVSPDKSHRLALERLAREPVLDLGLRSDDGTGALLAVAVLRAAVSG